MESVPFLIVVDEDPSSPSETAQEPLVPQLVDQRAARQDAARLVALWLRGKSFALGQPGTNLSAASELFDALARAGFLVWYVGDCVTCVRSPGRCMVHDGPEW